jgi:ribosome-binding ATPase YchF (GTP1/OBG family)
VLVLLNIGEGEIATAGRSPRRSRWAIATSMPSSRRSRQIEMEPGELEADEAASFMTELELLTGSDRVIALSYRLLGLSRSSLPAGRVAPGLCRTRRPPCGRRYPLDLARVIRAETVAYVDLLALGSMAEAQGRAAALQGKTYRAGDGDVLESLPR